MSNPLLPPVPPLPRPSLFRPVQYEVRDRVYKQQRVQLDGYIFTNCVFLGCDVFTGRGNFVLRECFFNNCRLYFVGSANRVVKLANLLELGTIDLGIMPTYHEDGSVTIE
jgi:hypothetical protein